MSDNYEEVHITTIDGNKVYWPKGNMARLAPAAVCGLAQQIIELRNFIKEYSESIHPDLVNKLNKIARQIPFENKFLLGKSIEVHNVIKEIGKNYEKY